MKRPSKLGDAITGIVILSFIFPFSISSAIVMQSIFLFFFSIYFLYAGSIRILVACDVLDWRKHSIQYALKEYREYVEEKKEREAEEKKDS